MEYRVGVLVLAGLWAAEGEALAIDVKDTPSTTACVSSTSATTTTPCAQGTVSVTTPSGVITQVKPGPEAKGGSGHDPAFLAYSYSGVGTIAVWSSSGVWTPKVNSSLTIPAAFQIVKLDLNNDGLDDLAWLDVGSKAVFVYYDIYGKGPFTVPAAKLALADTNVTLSISADDDHTLTITDKYGNTTEHTGDASHIQ